MKIDKTDDLSAAIIAQALVGLDETKKEFLKQENKAPGDLNEKHDFEREKRELQLKLKSEAKRFADSIRRDIILEDIQKVAKKNKSLWHRFKLLIGWAS